MFASKDIFLKSSGGYQISRSVRLRSSASAYFNRTFGAGSQTTWTFSAWVKLGTLGTDRTLLSCGSGATDSVIYFQGSTNQILLNLDNVTYRRTTQVFRDPSAWYHIVVVLNTSNATAQNRLRLYINGAEVTDWALNSTVALNATPSFNSAIAHNMARYISGASLYFDGYMTEINFIDGQALTPSSFGETNSVTGVWQPKRYAGTYGTNGFYLNFSDNSGVTATTIGKDYSGNGNNWTPNNISITAGATYDSMLDVPTPYADGGNGRGNYAVLNPLSISSNYTLSNANLTVASGSGTGGFMSPFGVSSGKWYWEVTITAASVSPCTAVIGVANTSDYATVPEFPGFPASGSYGYYGADGSYRHSGNTTTAYGATYANGDVIGIALDLTSNTLTMYKNNTSQGTMVSSLPAGTYFPAFGDGSTPQTFTLAVNFGQRPFSYTPPTGFKALNTQNLPTPTISNGASYMAATTYTGTGSALTIANTVGNASFQPDLVWVKGRSGATDHALYDAVRGVQKQLESNTTTAETTETTGLTAFGTTGFTIGALAQMNTNTATYVGWQWNAGGSTVTNTSGSISAQVRANATAGFSVVTYTGNGTGGATVGHGLGVAPRMVIVKPRAIVDNWNVYHASNGASPATQVLYLNLTNATSTNSTIWNNTAPTSSVFSIGTNSGINTNGSTYVAYCFAAVAGYSAFGSYTGNGSADGPFVFTGFRPRFVMTKRTDSTGGWVMLDSARDSYNVSGNILQAESSAAELAVASYPTLDILSNGFKIRSSTIQNASGGTYIFMAVAENPFKLSLAR